MEEQNKVMEEQNKALQRLNKDLNILDAMRQARSAGGLNSDQLQAIEAQESLVAKERHIEVEANVSEAFSCRTKLLEYEGSFVETLKWASDKRKEWQIVRSDTDEDGFFKIVVDRPGTYMLLAHGQAGFNDA